MKQTNNGLSIIIVNYNGVKFIKETLESLAEQLDKHTLNDYEILIVDNNSNDDSVPLIRKIATDIKKIIFFESQENLGFARGNNYLVSKAKFDNLMLINNDTQSLSLSESFHLVKTGKLDRKAIYTAKILNRDKSLQQNTFGRPKPIKLIIDLFLIKRLVKFFFRKKMKSPDSAYYFSGCFLLMKRSLFEEVGGFDERYTFYHEEADFFIRQSDSINRKILNDEIIHFGGGGSEMSDFAFTYYYVGLFKLYFFNHLIRKGMLLFLFQTSFFFRILLLNLGFSINYLPIDMYKSIRPSRTRKEVIQLHKRVLQEIKKI